MPFHAPCNSSGRVAGILAIVAAILLANGHARAEALYTPDSVIAKDMPGGLMMRASGTESFSYDTNPLMLAGGGRKDLWGSVTAPELVVSDKTPLSNITSDTVLNINAFNQPDFNSNDVHSKLNIARRTQRWSIGLLGTVDSDTTRSSEPSSYNTPRITPVGHMGFSVAPQIGYRFLPTDMLAMDAGFTSSSYDHPAFSDYRYMSLAPTYSHDFDPLNTGLVSLNVRRYQTTSGASNTTDTVGPSIGWKRKLTSRLSGEANVGVQENRQRGSAITNTSWQTQYNFSGALAFQGDQDNVELSTSRGEYPFGNGYEALQTEVALNATHAVNARLSLGIEAGYRSASYPSDATGDLETLATGKASATYALTQEVGIVGSYQYSHETLIGIASAAEKSVALLCLAYVPRAWTLSR